MLIFCVSKGTIFTVVIATIAKVNYSAFCKYVHRIISGAIFD